MHTDFKIREFPHTVKYKRYAIIFDSGEVWSTNVKHIKRLIQYLEEEKLHTWEDIPIREKNNIISVFGGTMDWYSTHEISFPELCELINRREKELAYGSETIILGKFISEFGYPNEDNKRMDDNKNYAKVYGYYGWLYLLLNYKMEIN